MKINRLFLLGLVLFLASAVSAQDLISANELKKNLKNADYVIVNAAANQKVFIRGAIDLPHGTLCTDEPVRNVIKSPEAMAAELGNHGISSDKTIVVYDEGSTKYAGRMYWMLKYLGAPNVKMLDGNITGWKAIRGPIGGATKGKKTTFTANVDASQLATMDEVKKAVDNSAYVIVDARTPEEYAGTAETELARPGHVPSAVNVNYETLADGKGLLKSNETLTSMFESKGITKDKTVIVYCETSVRAGVIYLALKGLGYPNVKVYDGAYLEWQSVDSNKVG
ncbi:sulfurtransferase [uncultured Draconibacterium sp.]|uniref:sulfurtransferase n=1 Tax=uncultured Draconibacterium sp. TaxID=1573823 RepID=UPI0029C78CCF|nr:sulfurtransferase [uncultured Draconibacterium sp.]